MSYIGKTPVVGNFQVCDAISVVNGQAAYTMQVGSANVLPESVNNMLVSLNGVIQKPNSAYTVSGSTITFASNLASGDVIDFIQIFGDVLNIGTPSDGAVTSTKLASNSVTTAKITDANVTGAKTNFVSTSSAAGLQIKGDGTTDGTLQLNCSQNSHGIKLKSPPHSASASYTLTFPNNDGDANEFLQTNGSGVLTWAEAGGGLTVADQWRYTGGASFSTEAVIDANLERVDATGQGTIGSAMTQSSGIFTFPSTGIYLVNFIGNFYSTGNTRYAFNQIRVTTNNSSYSSVAQGYQAIYNVSSATYANVSTSTLVDVTSTSNVKVAFAFSSDAAIVLQGSTDKNFTHMTFLRLGDT